MGSNNSKANTDEPLVFVPTQATLKVTSELAQALNSDASQNKKEKVDYEPEQFERLVNQKVKEEIERIQKEEIDIMKNQSNSNLSDTNLLLEHVKDLNSKHTPKQMKELPENVTRSHEELIKCYKEKSGQTLNCYQQVLDFSTSVQELQKEFIASKN